MGEMTAHVNEQGIVLRGYHPTSLLPRGFWNELLDELRSEHIPGRYPDGERMYIEAQRAVIYFTANTVSPDEAETILQRRGFSVFRDIELSDLSDGH